MAVGNFSKLGRRTLAVVAVAVLASVAMAAAHVKVVSAKVSANTVVVTLKNTGDSGASGAVTVFAVASDGHVMQSATPFSVAAAGQVTAVVVFDSVIGSVSGADCGVIADAPTPM